MEKFNTRDTNKFPVYLTLKERLCIWKMLVQEYLMKIKNTIQKVKIKPKNHMIY